MVNSSVLVLNRSFFPVNLTTVKHAFCMVCRGVAKIVDEQYKTFDYESWSQITVEQRADGIGLVEGREATHEEVYKFYIDLKNGAKDFFADIELLFKKFYS